jgi:N-acetylglutamate synthase
LFIRNRKAAEMDLKALLPEIEAAAVRGWPALETTLLDGWLWRHSTGGSIRANSVAALQYQGADVEASIDKVEALARWRAAAACFTISDVSQPTDLEARLKRRGYVHGGDHVTMAKRVDHNALMPAAATCASRPSDPWLKIYLGGLSADRRGAAPDILARLPTSAIYVGALINRHLTSCGLTIPDGAVASVQCMATHPDARRQGGAQLVLAAIETSAAARGIKALYLQTGADNIAARKLYAGLGYEAIGTYHTRTKAI